MDSSRENEEIKMDNTLKVVIAENNKIFNEIMAVRERLAVIDEDNEKEIKRLQKKHDALIAQRGILAAIINSQI
jgi:hypothetical protein